MGSKWAEGRAWDDDVWIGKVGLGDLAPGASVTALWTSPDTVVITADGLDIDAAADSVVVELSARVTDPDGTTEDHEDDVAWPS